MVIREGSPDRELVLPGPGEVVGRVPGMVRGVLGAFRGAPRFSVLFIILAIVCTIFAPLISPFDPIKVDHTNILQAPGFSEHLLGTDNQGRDNVARLIYGARTSVTVAGLAVVLAASVGTLIALVSGVFRGWVDTLLMRFTDGFLALPYLMVALTVIAILGPSVTKLILVIGLLRWMGFARVLRGEVLRLTEMDFVRLALVAGATKPRIMVRHVFPNIINTLLVLATLEIGLAVILEATLTFLGLGVPRPTASWGSTLFDAQKFLFLSWWYPIIPGVAISMLVMSFNLTGDWLRDRADPTRRQL